MKKIITGSKSDNRLTIKQMRDQLDELDKNGFGDKYIFVGNYYITDTYDIDDTSVWNDVTYDVAHYENFKLTKEQKNYLDSIEDDN
jgi:hypothetical protein